MRMLAENLGRLARDHRVCHPTQHMVQGSARQSRGVEERLDNLRRLSGIETGGVFGILGRRWKGFMRPSSPASSPR
jgi:hypothetical protein